MRWKKDVEKVWHWDNNCVPTNEDWAEKEGDGDVDNWGRHVQEPVRGHWEKSQEEQKEEQTVLVLFNLEERKIEPQAMKTK